MLGPHGLLLEVVGRGRRQDARDALGLGRGPLELDVLVPEAASLSTLVEEGSVASKRC